MSPDRTGGSQSTVCTGPENTKEVRNYNTQRIAPHWVSPSNNVMHKYTQQTKMA